MTWLDDAHGIAGDNEHDARHRLASRWAHGSRWVHSRQPSTLRAKAARRGAMLLIVALVVPLAVIIAHLASVDDTVNPNGPGISNRQDHFAAATGIPPVPTTDPTEPITQVPESTPPIPGRTTGSTTTPSASRGASPSTPATSGPGVTTQPGVAPLLVDDFSGNPGWTGGRGSNDLGNTAQCEVFVSCTVSGGALVLRYDDDGWFGSHVDRSLADHTYLVLRIRGEHGGEESDIRLTLGGVQSRLADLTLSGGGHPRITTVYQDVRIPLAVNGISRTDPGEFQLDFWHGGNSTAYIDEVRFE